MLLSMQGGLHARLFSLVQISRRACSHAVMLGGVLTDRPAFLQSCDHACRRGGLAVRLRGLADCTLAEQPAC